MRGIKRKSPSATRPVRFPFLPYATDSGKIEIFRLSYERQKIETDVTGATSNNRRDVLFAIATRRQGGREEGSEFVSRGRSLKCALESLLRSPPPSYLGRSRSRCPSPFLASFERGGERERGRERGRERDERVCFPHSTLNPRGN